MFAYKAVILDGDIIHSLGMGQAKQIPFVMNNWMSGGKCGISAGTTLANARKVIEYILERRFRPIPHGQMAVFKVEGRGKIFESKWRLIFKSLRLVELIEIPKLYNIQWRGRTVKSPRKGRFAGHKGLKIYGRLDCKTGMRMKKENRVFFYTTKDAELQGYRPCGHCKPKR